MEDNPDERAIVKDLLARRVKNVIEAANGSEALLLYKKYKPDILLTDLMMPVMNGIELVQELKSLGSDMEVIVASAYDKRSYFIDSINAGVNQFILKPFARLAKNPKTISAATMIASSASASSCARTPTRFLA